MPLTEAWLRLRPDTKGENVTDRREKEINESFFCLYCFYPECAKNRCKFYFYKTKNNDTLGVRQIFNPINFLCVIQA